MPVCLRNVNAPKWTQFKKQCVYQNKKKIKQKSRILRGEEEKKPLSISLMDDDDDGI